MVNWTKPPRMCGTHEEVRLLYTIPDHTFGRLCIVKNREGKEEYATFTEEGGQYGRLKDVENIPDIRTVTRYFVAHANDSGDSCNIYRDASQAKRDKIEKYTGILGKIDWTITDGKSTDQVMTVLESWNAPTPN